MAGKEAIYDFIQVSLLSSKLNQKKKIRLLKDIILFQSVDSESPWVDDLNFTSAHYRWVHFECKSANIKLRDYPQTLADAKHVLCWGRYEPKDSKKPNRQF
jgi:hypothetical protein